MATLTGLTSAPMGYSENDIQIIQTAVHFKPGCKDTPTTDPFFIPQWMRKLKRFGIWGRVHGTNKMCWGLRKGKLVTGANGKGRESDFMTFEDAIAWQNSEQENSRARGVTFFLGEGYSGIDIDGVRCPETGEFTSFAKNLLKLAWKIGAYVEVSPSKTGFKFFGELGRIFCHGKNAASLPQVPGKTEGIGPGAEVYLSSRHFALTGQIITSGEGVKVSEAEPVDLTPILELIEMEAGLNGPPPSSTQPEPVNHSNHNHGESIADWFNGRINFLNWLKEIGYKEVKRKPGKYGGEDIYLTRPGKDSGVSLVLGSCNQLVYNWSSSSVIPTERGMSPFRFWAFRYAHGDEVAAARTLAAWKRDNAIGSIPTQVIPEISQGTKWERSGSGPNNPPAITRDPSINPEHWKKLEWKPFPVEALPKTLRRFVEEISRDMGCDPSLIAMPALAAAASAVGNSRVLRVKRKWKAPCILWAAVISESGTKKTPPFDAAIEPIKKIQQKRIRELEEKKKSWKSAHAKWKAAEARYSKGQSAADPGPEPEIPALEYALANDCTVAKLIQNLVNSPRGILLARDELSAWIASFQKQGTTSDMPSWLGMHNGESIQRDRVGLPGSGGESVYIPRAAVSICGGIQPGILKRVLTQEHSEAGLDARIIAAMPPKVLDRWREEELSPETEAAWEKLINFLLGLKMGMDEEGFPIPQEIVMTPKARERWEKFYNEWARHKFVSVGGEASLASKLEGTVPRLALLFHLIDQAENNLETLDPVDDLQMKRAIELVQWFGREWARIRQELGREPDKIESRLVDLIKKSGKEGLFKSQIHQAFSNNLKKEVLDATLNGLLTQGVLVRETVHTAGKPAERWLATEFQNSA